MSQHDMYIDNNTRTNVRMDINAALQALASTNSGATPPAKTYPYQLWADTNTGWLKIRNGANNNWIYLLNLADIYAHNSYHGVVRLATISEVNQGLEELSVITPFTLAYAIQRSVLDYVETAGTNSYTASLPSNPIPATGFELKVKFTNASTGPSTLNLNNGGALKILVATKSGYVQANAGDITANMYATLAYDNYLDGGADAWVMKNGQINYTAGLQTLNNTTFSTSSKTFVPVGTSVSINPGPSGRYVLVSFSAMHMLSTTGQIYYQINRDNQTYRYFGPYVITSPSVYTSVTYQHLFGPLDGSVHDFSLECKVSGGTVTISESKLIALTW